MFFSFPPPPKVACGNASIFSKASPSPFCVTRPMHQYNVHRHHSILKNMHKKISFNYQFLIIQKTSETVGGDAVAKVTVTVNIYKFQGTAVTVGGEAGPQGLKGHLLSICIR